MFEIKLLSSYRKKFFVSLTAKLFKSPISLISFLIGKTFLSNVFSQTVIGCGIGTICVSLNISYGKLNQSLYSLLEIKKLKLGVNARKGKKP